METFLSEVATQILTEHPNDLDQITVVFNNRRSGLFLKKQFIEHSKKAMFLPQIIGIDDLISDLGNIQIIPNEFLLFELFNIHQHIENTSRKFNTFEEFISFGEMMISDFSEIDLYQVDAKKLFSNLYDLKKIEEWNPETNVATTFQTNYLKFYQSLYQYYTNLHERLEEMNMAYSGMAYRKVAENINTLINKFDNKYCYFVGFNALSECEKDIITTFCNLDMGKVITDGDAYYYNDKRQEAGIFLHKHKEIFHPQYDDHFGAEDKYITIVSCPENILQTKYVGQILANQSLKNTPIEQTAIVLSDEELLTPMLSSLPSKIGTANISMGLSFIKTQTHALILKLFSLYQRIKFNGFYHQDILDILSDYHILNLIGDKNIWKKASNFLSKNNIVYVTHEDLKDLADKLKINLSCIDYIFANLTPTPNEFLSNTTKLINQLYDIYIIYDPQIHKNKSINPKETEALGCLHETIDYFVKLQQKYNYIQTLNTLQKIYARFAQHRTISFCGEPLSGLQILGVLETRNLDFKKVIMLSVNEGIIPSGKNNNTLIPLQLKSQFKIPTYKEKDAIYAYHFYRFLQRANDIHLLYHTESDDNASKGERSRFIIQLENELAKRYKNIHIKKVNLSANYTLNQTQLQSISKKTDAVMAKLKILAQKGFSPSGLNLYRNCPLQFYYHYVLNAKQIDEVNEELSASELGSLIHKVLEKIYIKNHLVSKKQLTDGLANIDSYIADAYKDIFHHKITNEGPNYLICSLAKEQISNIITKEIKQIEGKNVIQIVDVEKTLEGNITISPQGDIAKIRGTIDRIDYFNQIFRIIDYKTGRVKDEDLIYSNNDNNSKDIPDKLFQVMTYLWLYLHQPGSPTPTEIQAGIYPLQDIHKDFIPGNWNGETAIDSSIVNEFEAILTHTVQDIMNPTIEFKPSKKATNSCKFCPMNTTCHKS